jgi:multidrug efflux pump subunit AcrA (membrane-fusion protein)
MNTKKIFIVLSLSLILLFTLSACEVEETPVPVLEENPSLDFVIAEGHIVPRQHSWLSFLARGRVTEILVEEGDQVVEDQVLMHLADPEEAEATLLAAELELIAAQQDFDHFLRTADLAEAQAWQAYQQAQILRAELEEDWEDLNLDFLEDEVDDALIEVRDREDELEDAQEEWEDYQDVDEDNFSRRAAEDDLEEAQENYNQALRDLEEAIREIDEPRSKLDAALAAEIEARRDYEMWLEEGFDLDQKALLESRLAAAEVSLAAAQNALENYSLNAPFSGTVTDIYLELGQLVGPEIVAAQLADLSEFEINTSDLTELEVVKIVEGQTVEIIPDALPEVLLLGSVESIGESFTTQAGDIIYTVVISLNETNPNLRWGMTVEVKFLPD